MNCFEVRNITTLISTVSFVYVPHYTLIWVVDGVGCVVGVGVGVVGVVGSGVGCDVEDAT